MKLKSKPSLIKKINEHLKKVANPPHKPGKRFRIKPSDIGHPSMRRIFYSSLRVEPDFGIDPKGKRIFDTGDAFHEMIRGWVKDLGILIEYVDPKTGKPPIHWAKGKPDPEFPINVPELDMHQGKIDALVEFERKLYVGEFKSIKDEKFHELNGPMKDHLMQANTYVHLFEYCWERGDFEHIEALKKYTEIAGVIFLYANKNDTELREYIVEKSDEGLELTVEKVAKLKGYIERKELPPCDAHNCSFCPWKKKCQAKYNPLVECESE